jgi:hypothetical protein
MTASTDVKQLRAVTGDCGSRFCRLFQQPMEHQIKVMMSISKWFRHHKRMLASSPTLVFVFFLEIGIGLLLSGSDALM